ncbi:MAG: histidine phosphatase family protein [Planctomycetes bacterium]|nr:histidine phosphatase family protein [Planctomycetota bacterium]
MVYKTGDHNGDGTVDLSDAVYLCRWIYLGGPPPVSNECDEVNAIDDAATGVGFGANSPESESKKKTIVYFVRHGEDVPELERFDPSFTVTFNNCNQDVLNPCCEEVLNPLGQARAAALADWFEAKHIARTLTHVIASHKIRTRQTVEKIALAAGLGGDLDGDGDLDGTDMDQAPGDGVINVPSTPLECDPGFTSSSSARQPQINYLKTLPLGSRAVVCSHSPVVYPLMRAFGVDTSDPVNFPKDSRGRVKGFNNLWIVQLDLVEVEGALQYQGRLLEHLLLDLNLEVSLINREHGEGDEDDEK